MSNHSGGRAVGSVCYRLSITRDFNQFAAFSRTSDDLSDVDGSDSAVGSSSSASGGDEGNGSECGLHID